MSRGRFVVLEGIEGAGKSTHAAYLAGWLEQQGIAVVAAREPGGTALGERLREILLDPELTGMPPLAELLLMFAARRASLEEVILPTLHEGAWVICDRFVDSSYAYQSYGRGVSLEYVEALEKQVLDGLRPDLTILLDTPVRLGLSRKADPQEADRFERESREFFERVRAGYLERAALGGDGYRIVDASKSLEEVQTDLRNAVRPLVGL
ncbi:MAG: dTMP kinase [Gammaproteobacteria bacterium]|nr:dTMP kinase [Gammaproteobacteria bacterium]